MGVVAASAVGGLSTATPVKVCNRGGIVVRECEVGVRIRRRRGFGIGFAFGLWSWLWLLVVGGGVDGGEDEEVILRFVCLVWVW